MKLRETIVATPIAVVVTALIAAGALLLGLYVAFTSDLRLQLKTEILADIDATTAADRVLPAVTALTVLDRQSTRDGRTGPLYLLIDPETRRPLAGNLPGWPPMTLGPDGCGSVERGMGRRSMIACTTRLDGHFPLLIARSTTGIGSTRDWMLWGYAALAIVVVIAGAAAGWFRLSRLRRRLSRMQVALDAFAKGDLAARPPPDGRDDVGLLSSGIGRTLDDLDHAITGQHAIAERIAHDLKRPVAIALATLDLDRPADEALATCRDRLADLNRIVDGILRIGEVAMRDDPLEPVALDVAARAIVDLYGEAAAARDVTILAELDPVVVMGRQEIHHAGHRGVDRHRPRRARRGDPHRRSRHRQGRTARPARHLFRARPQHRRHRRFRAGPGGGAADRRAVEGQSGVRGSCRRPRARRRRASAGRRIPAILSSSIR